MTAVDIADYRQLQHNGDSGAVEFAAPRRALTSATSRTLARLQASFDPRAWLS